MPDPAVLWRIQGFGHQTVASGQSYWWTNAGRAPAGKVYAQLTIDCEIFYIDRSGQTHTVKPGTLLLFRTGENTAYGWPPTQATKPAAYRCEWLGLMGAGLAEHWDRLIERFGGCVDLGSDTTVRKAMNRLMDAAYPTSGATPVVQAVAVQQFVMQLFTACERRNRRAAGPFESALDELLTNPLAVGTLAEVAKRFGVSREHLTREFRARTGQTPHQWVTKARTERAMQLLRDTPLSVAAIAEQSGFPSVHTMAWQLKRTTGKTLTQLHG